MSTSAFMGPPGALTRRPGSSADSSRLSRGYSAFVCGMVEGWWILRRPPTQSRLAKHPQQTRIEARRRRPTRRKQPQEPAPSHGQAHFSAANSSKPSHPNNTAPVAPPAGDSGVLSPQDAPPEDSAPDTDTVELKPPPRRPTAERTPAPSPVQSQNSHSPNDASNSQNSRSPARPRPRPRVFSNNSTQTLAYSSSSSDQDGRPSQNVPHLQPDAFVRCPQCFTVYTVHTDEVAPDGRVLRCSACLHEWFGATEELVHDVDEAAAWVEQGVDRRAAALSKVGDTAPPSRRQIKLDESRPITLFVGNLSFYATEPELREAFGAYGPVLRCEIPRDKNGRSRGYGFIEMRKTEDGLHAMQALQGVSVVGREILISKAASKLAGVECDTTADSEDDEERVESGEELISDEEAFFDGDEDEEEEDDSTSPPDTTEVIAPQLP